MVEGGNYSTPFGPRIDVPWLARIGASSYAIYLFHVFFTAASRIALGKAGLALLLGESRRAPRAIELPTSALRTRPVAPQLSGENR